MMKLNNSFTLPVNFKFMLNPVSRIAVAARYISLIIVVYLLLSSGCKRQGDLRSEDEETMAAQKLSTQFPEVSYTRAEMKPFMLQDIVNGKIDAYNTIKIKPEVSGYLEYFPWRNGDRIGSGAEILRINSAQWQLDLNKLHIDLKQAQLDRDERILLIGGEFGQDSSVSAQKLNYVTIKSGIDQIKQQIAATEWQLSRTIVKSPFAGYFADITTAPHQLVNAGEELTTLIDPNSLEVKCLVLESLALSMSKGQKVLFKPIHTDQVSYSGLIHVINPIVDKNGLVELRARILSNKQDLFHGMNVRVFIEQATVPYVVIPKTALVLRSNRSVVFTYDSANGRAKWNYVTVVHENENWLAVSEGLSEGDLVIHQGNLNLDHDTRVQIIADTPLKDNTPAK